MSILSSNKTLSIDFGSVEIKMVECKSSKKCVVISKNFSIKPTRDIYEDGEIQDMDQFSQREVLSKYYVKYYDYYSSLLSI